MAEYLSLTLTLTLALTLALALALTLTRPPPTPPCFADVELAKSGLISARSRATSSVDPAHAHQPAPAAFPGYHPPRASWARSGLSSDLARGDRQVTRTLTLTLTMTLTLTLTLTLNPTRRSRAASGACCCRRCSTRRWAARP